MVVTLDDKVALITGSSAGIGAATAILFSSLGAKVTLVGRNQEKLDKVAQECLTKSPKNYKPLVINAELEKEDDVKRILDQTIANYSRLDILVNNAGILSRKGFRDEGYLEDYDRVMRVNVRSSIELSHLARPYLAEAKGCIINVSSIGGLRPTAMWSYCVSKAAMDMVTKALAQELAPEIRVNSVNPGVVKTDIMNSQPNPLEIFDTITQRTPSKRYAQPEEIANVIAFLASDASSFMMGSIVVADGGSIVSNPYPTGVFNKE